MPHPPYQLLVVEDEFIIAEDLRGIVEGMGHRVAGVVARVSEALAWLGAHPRPDLVLLDVTLRGERDGVDLANQLRAEYALPFLFITSSADGPTIARIKHTQPRGYLVKPFKEAQVRVALEMAFDAEPIQARPGEAVAAAAGLPDSLFVRDRKQLVKVRFDELLWLEADGHYTFLHTATGKYTLSLRLKQVEERLPPAGFLRVHKSYVVALGKISALAGAFVRVGPALVPVGRAYQAHLLRHLNRLGSA